MGPKASLAVAFTRRDVNSSWLFLLLSSYTYIYISSSLFVASFFRSDILSALLSSWCVPRNGQERREFIARARFFRAPEVARLRLPVKNSALHSSGCACKLSKFFSFFFFFSPGVRQRGALPRLWILFQASCKHPENVITPK